MHLKRYQLIKLHLECHQLIKLVRCHSFWTKEVTQQGRDRPARRRNVVLWWVIRRARVPGIFINQHFRKATILFTVTQRTNEALVKDRCKASGDSGLL